MSPKRSDPEVADKLVEAAARVLAEEGAAAVTARRMAAEIGTSTMAVYTHFGGMDELRSAVWQRGFGLFGDELARPAHTADPVADWIAEGWGYRRFGLDHRHLYRVMFGDGLASFHENPADSEVAMATFGALLERIERNAESGRWQVDEVFMAGEIVWGTVHGLVAVEQAHYYDFIRRAAVDTYQQALIRLSVAFGDGLDRARVSAKAARRRARALV